MTWRRRSSEEVTKSETLRTFVGTVPLDNPVMNAAGTYGFSCEYGAYGPLSALGAFVTKSLSLNPKHGNSGQNLIPARGGMMLNSVGLKNPGVNAWLKDGYPELINAGAKVVVSLWGESENDLYEASAIVSGYEGIVAIEVNLSCPNVAEPRLLVSHNPGFVDSYVSAVVEGTSGSSAVVWAKLAPSSPDIVASAQAAEAAGAQGVTLVNTLSAMSVDLDRRVITLSGGYGGLSGPALHPIALRAVYQVHSALPRLPVVGVGGICNARMALELIGVGASAVQVGTASFRDPRAPHRILAQVTRWLEKRSMAVSDLAGSIRADHVPTDL
jgi:dihydroorotate dehydrogenase (NAD+) catalytic subunit